MGLSSAIKIQTFKVTLKMLTKTPLERIYIYIYMLSLSADAGNDLIKWKATSCITFLRVDTS